MTRRNGGLSVAARFWTGLLGAFGLAFVLYITSWFAVPAIAELAERGYGASPQNLPLPVLNPFARELAGRLGKLSGGSPSPGQARLEFNIALRQATAMFNMLYILLIAGTAAESLAVEKERDTGPVGTPGRSAIHGHSSRGHSVDLDGSDHDDPGDADLA